MLNRIHLETIDSTSNYAHLLVEKGEQLPDITLIDAEEQTAGRGQRGNSWETEPGKNVIFSLVCHPTWVHPMQQYIFSESIALSVVKALSQELPDEEVKNLSVKWPNDIYYSDKKISGTLIECDLFGHSISNCVIGTGVNINQQVFKSDAPNPISLFNIVGYESDREKILLNIVEEFAGYYECIHFGAFAPIHEEYKKQLYRNDGGFYPYEDARGSFLARIIDVEPSGRLILETSEGELRRYEFKEVRFLLKANYSENYPTNYIKK